jgi:23S rRNA pseudouridine2605 synthase
MAGPETRLGVSGSREVRRLARALSATGATSRTAAERLVEAGAVTVNGTTVCDPEARVRPSRDEILVHGAAVHPAPKRYLALNKPRGLVTTACDERGRPTVYDCLSGQTGPWLAPVGRLDKASEGLIFFSNDARWAHAILAPASHLPKVYHVQIGRHLAAQDLACLQSGARLAGGGEACMARITLLRQGKKTCWLEIVLHQGRNRQIRRMFEEVGAEVLRLVRVAIGPVTLGDLPKGGSRALTEHELRAIDAALAASLEDHKLGAGRTKS